MSSISSKGISNEYGTEKLDQEGPHKYLPSFIPVLGQTQISNQRDIYPILEYKCNVCFLENHLHRCIISSRCTELYSESKSTIINRHPKTSVYQNYQCTKFLEGNKCSSWKQKINTIDPTGCIFSSASYCVIKTHKIL